MTEAVVERVEVEAPAEEVFGFLSDVENVCALVRAAEETRRVDFSESLWSFRGPSGRSVEFGPDAFRGCLRRERLWSETSPDARERAEVFFGSGRWADRILERGEVDVESLSSGKTLLVLRTFLADRERAREARGQDSSPDEPADDFGAVREALNLDLRAVFTHLLPASWLGERARLLDNLAVDAVEGDDSALEAAAAMTDEDRAWLEGDISRLGEYDPYELTEEQLAEERPIRYVPGLGLIVEDDADDQVGPSDSEVGRGPTA